MNENNGGSVFPSGETRFDQASVGVVKTAALHPGISLRDLAMLVFIHASIRAEDWSVEEQEPDDEMRDFLNAHKILADEFIKVRAK